jgi:hypothetical protein
VPAAVVAAAAGAVVGAAVVGAAVVTAAVVGGAVVGALTAAVAVEPVVALLSLPQAAAVSTAARPTALRIVRFVRIRTR